MNFADPVNNVKQMGLHDGMKVADLGAGSGHYALAAAAIVGKEGRVYAVDIQEDVLKPLRDEAATRGLKNVETVWGDIERAGGTLLRDKAVDAVIVSNVIFQLDDIRAAISEMKRILKSGGKLLLVDWAGDYNGMGPHKDEVITEHEAEELFITGGFHKAKGFRGGPHHYSILFTAP